MTAIVQGLRSTRQRPWASWLVTSLALLPAVFGGYGLAGWVLKLPSFVQPAPQSIPMAPSTATLFILLSSAVLARLRRAAEPGARWAAPVAFVVALVAATLAVTSGRGLFLGIEHLGLLPETSAQGVPLGHMSPATAVLFVASSLSFLASAPAWGRRAWVGDAARAFAALGAVSGFVLTLTYLWGVEPLYAALLVPPAALTSLAFLSLGLSLFGLPTVLDANAPETSGRPATMSATYLLAISAFAFGGVTIGALTYRTFEINHRDEVQRQLTLLGELKVDELAAWRRERWGNADILTHRRALGVLVQSFLDEPWRADLGEELRQWMGSYVTTYGYQRADLLDASGQARLSIPADLGAPSPHLAGEAMGALKSGTATWVDLSRDGTDGPLHLAVVAPIPSGGGGEPPIAALVLQIDPEAYVYPVLRQGPTAGRTAETLLVRREGDDVVFLNALRFDPGAALNLRLPLSQADLPAAAAARGVTGLFEGRDYRGVPVLAYLSPVRDSPWFLVTRIDMEEVYEPLVARRLQTVLVVGVLLLGVAGGIGLLWRQERRGQDRAEAALQVSRDRMQSTLDSMLEGAQIIGFDYRYLYVNDSVAAQGKQPKAELLGRTMMERYPGIDQTEFFRGLRRCMEQRESLRLENEFTFPDGSQGWFDLSLQPVPEGVFILSQDVTERKRAEQAVRRHAEELEVRVAERTQELQAANRELEAFSYSVSHDLRAPLRAADGFARILQEDHADSLPADARRYLDLVRGSTQQMGRLIDDLLAFSRLGRQAISRRPVQPATVARQAIEQLQDGQEGRRVEIEVEEMPDVSADPQLLLQVYVNLLSNALKFSRGREPARIQIGSCEQDGERVYFVRDNGAGFDMGYVDKLFGVFQRLHRAEEFEGTGVGLAIVQRIVHRHGGRAWAEGAVDQGATFYFTLPEGSEG